MDNPIDITPDSQIPSTQSYFNHCTGCTDPNTEGTHQADTIEHQGIVPPLEDNSMFERDSEAELNEPFLNSIEKQAVEEINDPNKTMGNVLNIPHPGGRPTVMTDATVAKLRDAFLMGCNIKTACAYAEISRDAYYDYIKQYPEFSDKVDEWQQNPILKAMKTIFDKLDNEDTAKWYLERRNKEDFSPRQEVTGGNGAPIPVKIEYVIPEPNTDQVDTNTETTPGMDSSS